MNYYIQIPGTETYELPPLLMHRGNGLPEEVSELDLVMSEAEDMLAATDADQIILERRKFDLAVQLADRYKALVGYWKCGDSVVDWIRQCEITFQCTDALRDLLHPDVWPHAGRASFVTLLNQKDIPTPGVDMETAVGLRLTFRQPPPVDYCSNQFLFYLNGPIAHRAYQTWSGLISQERIGMFPPERFHFDVVHG